MKVGAKVWYWARRVGERAHKKHGVIVQLSGTLCRVRLDESSRRGDIISVQTVEIKRLRLEEGMNV